MCALIDLGLVDSLPTLDHPLATDVDLYAGEYTITVPPVPYRKSYIVCRAFFSQIPYLPRGTDL